MGMMPCSRHRAAISLAVLGWPLLFVVVESMSDSLSATVVGQHDPAGAISLSDVPHFAIQLFIVEVGQDVLQLIVGQVRLAIGGGSHRHASGSSGDPIAEPGTDFGEGV
jgi:hypothetical protein